MFCAVSSLFAQCCWLPRGQFAPYWVSEGASRSLDGKSRYVFWWNPGMLFWDFWVCFFRTSWFAFLRSLGLFFWDLWVCFFRTSGFVFLGFLGLFFANLWIVFWAISGSSFWDLQVCLFGINHSVSKVKALPNHPRNPICIEFVYKMDSWAGQEGLSLWK